MYYKLWLYASVTSRSKRIKGRGEEGYGSRLRVFSPLPSSLLSSPPLPSPILSSPLTPLLSSPPLPSLLLSSLLVLILFYLLSNIGFLIAGVSLISSIIPSLPVPILCTPSLRGRR